MWVGKGGVQAPNMYVISEAMEPGVALPSPDALITVRHIRWGRIWGQKHCGGQMGTRMGQG